MGPAAGDSHNFGRRVAIDGDRVLKPRTLAWERLLLDAASPLRAVLEEAAPGTFGFLPSLAFEENGVATGGAVERVRLAPLPDLDDDGRRELARVVGRATALYAWLGIADLHWENLALGADASGRTIFAPLDVEVILSDLALPTETKLLPDADPEHAAVARHAAGVRRALPWLGKPILAPDLVAMAAAYLATLALLDQHARAIADALLAVPALQDAPIRVLLRGTDEYVQRHARRPWPPLLDAEREQLDRGDIPYFFRLYGRPGIHWYASPSLDEVKRLPLSGDVPRLEPLLSLSRGLRSDGRASLAEQGLFTLLAAFDHRSLAGAHAVDGLTVTFRKRRLVVDLPGGEELDARRDLRGVVGSVYLPCRCGEVREALVPPVTRCEAP